MLVSTNDRRSCEVGVCPGYHPQRTAAIAFPDTNGCDLRYAKWAETPAIGNGRLGSMVFGGVDEEDVQLNAELRMGTNSGGSPGAFRDLSAGQ
ncbi:MAG: glycoside hydrolase N-terminal domain-containing protein [Planctomycetota bacterium]|nr:glycoside hydrolase N-terminal domain-containing protein [Planctomycetota bacterium]